VSPADAAQLLALASRVGSLIVDRRDPERFFAERSDIAHQLRALSRGEAAVPSGYKPLPAGTQCNCLHEYQTADGRRWCCKGDRAGSDLADGYDDQGRPVHAFSARDTALRELKDHALRVGLQRAGKGLTL
jgi:hypothetical protein